MATTQSKHVLPTKYQHSYLVGTGLDKSLSHIIGQEFVYKSTQDGKVTKIDTKNNLIFLSYKDGTTAAIDTSSKPVYNSQSGFYISSHLTPIDQIKEGYTFKKGKILAYDKSFFNMSRESDNGCNFSAGKLTNVAITCLGETFEDSSVATSKFKDEMTSTIISDREVVLKKNSRIISMAKIGDVVSVSDPLVVFEEVGDDEKSALDLLDKIDKENSEELQDLAKSQAKAKYAGKIVDIKIYYNTDLDNLHESLRSIVQEYITKYERKSNALKNTRNDEIIEIPSTSKIEHTKIFGQEMDGVMISFFISYEDQCKVGDKITFFSVTI